MEEREFGCLTDPAFKITPPPFWLGYLVVDQHEVVHLLQNTSSFSSTQ